MAPDNIRVRTLDLPVEGRSNEVTEADVRLIVAEKQESRGIDTSQSDLVTSLDKTLPPPVNAYALQRLVQESAILRQCIRAMEVNIEAFGYDLQYVGPPKDPKNPDESGDKDPDAIAEKKRILNFFKSCNPHMSFTALRRRLRQDFESVGNAYVEVIETVKGDVAWLEHLPPQNILLTAPDPEEQDIEIVFIGEEGEIIKKEAKQKFRRYRQRVQTKTVWFKEFGDPRDINWMTGELVEGGLLDEKLRGTAIIHFANYVSGQPYGMPEWIGSTPEVIGTRQASLANLSFFSKNCIPAMALLITGGGLTEVALDRIKTGFEEGGAGIEKLHRVLVLEAVADTQQLGDKQTVTMKLQSLVNDRMTDQQFGKYIDTNEKRIRSTWRLAPIAIGLSEDLNFASANAARVTAEEQVFVPARREEDEVWNTTIMRRLKARFWELSSNGPEISDMKDTVVAISAFRDAWALSPNNARELARELLGIEIKDIDEEWGDWPIPVVLELLTQGQLKGLDAIKEEPKPGFGPDGKLLPGFGPDGKPLPPPPGLKPPGVQPPTGPKAPVVAAPKAPQPPKQQGGQPIGTKPAA
jgi:PBSX family phage portal protein